MVDFAGDHKGLAGEDLLNVLGVLPVKMQFRKERVKSRGCALIFKISGYVLREHRADPLDRGERLPVRLSDLIDVVVKVRTQDPCSRDADAGYSRRAQHSGQRSLPGFFDRFQQFVTGFLPKAVHVPDHIPVRVKMIDVREIMDQSGSDQFLQSHLGESVDIHSAAADKKRERLDLLRGAVRICADQDFRIVVPSNAGILPAHRTFGRDHESAGSCQVLGDLGYDHIGFVDRDPVSDPEF